MGALSKRDFRNSCKSGVHKYEGEIDMSKKMIWGLAAFILIIGLGLCGVLLIRQPDSEPEKIYNVPSEEVIRQSQKANAPRSDRVMAEGAYADSPPPAAPGFKWVRQGHRWDKVPVSQAQGKPKTRAEPTAVYGITRQGKRYKINPVHADVPAATATPTGPPLHIDWQDDGHPPPGSVINWRDPRTWESYRNFWGFEPPKFSSQTGYEYRPRLDNWGTPLQHFDGTEIITHYKKRIGFRPSPAQLAEYKQLQAQLETARVSGDNLLADNLQQDILSLMNSARGELPIKHTFHSMYYGPPLDLNDKEKVEALQEASIRDLYKRMGIEHLYEFYEKD